MEEVGATFYTFQAATWCLATRNRLFLFVGTGFRCLGYLDGWIQSWTSLFLFAFIDVWDDLFVRYIILLCLLSERCMHLEFHEWNVLMRGWTYNFGPRLEENGTTLYSMSETLMLV